MEKEKVMLFYRSLLGRSLVGAVILTAWAGFAFGADKAAPADDRAQPKIVYPKKTELDFEGAQIEGEMRNPGEFYFQHRTEEKFDSLVKRRKNFHREMLRDAVLSK